MRGSRHVANRDSHHCRQPRSSAAKSSAATPAEDLRIPGLRATAGQIAPGWRKQGGVVIRILTVDDHALLRNGIRTLLGAESDMQLVGEASTGREAIQEFRTHRPD